jgi:class 3 adenylate cyclase/tetratricopeptide (TPR) repeat protein
MPACPRCGEPTDERARFCPACGLELTGVASGVGRLRKTVTVLFTDVADWTTLGERHDPEQVRGVMERYSDEARAILERHGGTVEKFIGDAVMAVFGIPLLHEDDALRALRAAVELRDALVALNAELERDFGVRIAVRTGVNSGEVITGDASRGEGFITGDAVNVTQRLQQQAAPGEILIGRSTYRLARDAVRVEPLEPLTVKGKRDPVVAYRLRELVAGAPSHARRLDSPMVGRGRELSLLRDALARAVRERSCHLFTVLGPAGVGKSRLVAELLAGLGETTVVLRGSCLPYGEGITYWPLREIVAQAAGIDDRSDGTEAVARISQALGADESAETIANRLGELLGLTDAAGSTDERLWAVRRSLEILAQSKPVIVVIDDVHWAEPALLDLIEYMADWSRDAPMLLLCLARPDLLDARPSWGGGKLNATTILLEPLSSSESERLIDNLLGTTALPAEARSRIQHAAEGNPLFVEEMLAMLMDAGLLRRENGGWLATGDLSEIQVPTTIRILLATRLDRLGDFERRVIERAAVEGKVFHRSAVQALSPELEPDRVGACLLALVRKELIRHERGEPAGEDAFRFRHILIREAAYEAIPKAARSELHERFAEWLGRSPGDHAEFVGYHLEQAVQYRRELGPAGERERELAARAGALLAAEGKRASARGDYLAAVNLFERSRALLPASDSVELLIDLGTALAFAGELARAEATLDEAAIGAAAQGDDRLAAHAALQRAFLDRYMHPERGMDDVVQAAERAIEVFEAARDDVGLARAWRLLAEVRWTKLQIARMEDALARAQAHAERAGAEHEILLVLDGLVRAAVAGPLPVDEAVTRCLDAITRAAGHRTLSANVDAMRAYLEAMRGDFETARRLAETSEGTLLELGAMVDLAALRAWTGEIEMLAGNPHGGEEVRRAAYETLERLGERAILSTIAAFLAESLYAQGRDDEALAFALVSADAAGEDDITSQILWRVTAAKAKARRGALPEAEELARQAVGLAEETDCLNLHGDALVGLAEVLAASGRRDEAAALSMQAVRLFEAKGNLVSADARRRRLETLGVTSAADRAGRGSSG